MAAITFGGKNIDLPPAFVPYLMRLGKIVDDAETSGIAGVIERDSKIIQAALDEVGAGLHVHAVETSFQELNRLAGEVMRGAGFRWSAPGEGEEKPAADAGSPTSSATLSPPSPPAADTSGPETSAS